MVMRMMMLMLRAVMMFKMTRCKVNRVSRSSLSLLRRGGVALTKLEPNS